MPLTAAIVPARDEAPTVAGVVRALRGSGAFAAVVVVDDGSTDGTALEAGRAGATVVRGPALGKAEAMAAGICAVPWADPVAFFDADLDGLRPEHAAKMAALSRSADMVLGEVDRGVLTPFFGSFMLTGQRVLRRWIWDAMPPSCRRGYLVEIGLNEACRRQRGHFSFTLLEGVTTREKMRKRGLVEGSLQNLRMFREIAMAEACIDAHGSCAVPATGPDRAVRLLSCGS